MIRGSLLANLKLENLDEFTAQNYMKLPVSQQVIVCQVVAIAMHVKYVDTKVAYTTSENVPDLEPIQEAVNSSLFTKTLKDIDQKEFRIALLLQNKTLGLLSVKTDPILLPISPLYQTTTMKIFTE